jgi:hypothetical protein
MVDLYVAARARLSRCANPLRNGLSYSSMIVSAMLLKLGPPGALAAALALWHGRLLRL